MMKLGSHMSTAGGAWKAIERARSVDCESTQIFVKSNMQWFGKPPKPADAADALALAITHIWRGGAQARLEQALARSRGGLRP